MDEERYSRHMLLPQIGRAGQQRVRAGTALVMGLGGLGSPAAMYLASAGVGRLVLADFDVVELSNLQRQIVHFTPDVGREKVASARDKLEALNPDVAVETIGSLLDDAELKTAIARVDVVVDATDNFETRFAVNAACVGTGTSLVSGAVLAWDGQITAFEPANPESPCYRCLYAEGSEEGASCAEVGVFAPLLGIVGSMQAAEALKILAGMGSALVGRVLVLDGLHMRWHTLRLKRDPACPVCSKKGTPVCR
jgi:molybdopterin/thiamine biosynthesis adenylyltransferase